MSDAADDDPELGLRDTIGSIKVPAPDTHEIVALVQEAEERLVAVAEHLRSAAQANDFDALLSHAGQAILAAEAAEHAAGLASRAVAPIRAEAGRIEQAVRRALAEAMVGAGLLNTPISDMHEVAAAAGSERVEIDVPLAQLPPAYLRRPPPEANKDKIRRALQVDPSSVPGARLAAGPATVRISRREDYWG